jgi:hypothetical protein
MPTSIIGFSDDVVDNFGKFEDFIANLKLSNLIATTAPCLAES